MPRCRDLGDMSALAACEKSARHRWPRHRPPRASAPDVLEPRAHSLRVGRVQEAVDGPRDAIASSVKVRRRRLRSPRQEKLPGVRMAVSARFGIHRDRPSSDRSIGHRRASQIAAHLAQHRAPATSPVRRTPRARYSWAAPAESQQQLRTIKDGRAETLLAPPKVLLERRRKPKPRGLVGDAGALHCRHRPCIRTPSTKRSYAPSSPAAPRVGAAGMHAFDARPGR